MTLVILRAADTNDLLRFGGGGRTLIDVVVVALDVGSVVNFFDV